MYIGTHNVEFLEDHDDAKDDATDWDVSMDIRNGHERKSSTKLRKSKKAFKSKIEPFTDTTDATADQQSMTDNLESDLKVIGGLRGDLILVGENLITTKKSEAEQIPGKKYKPKPKSKRINSTEHLDEEHSPKMKSKHRKIGNHEVNSTVLINGHDSSLKIKDLITVKKDLLHTSNLNGHVPKQKSEHATKTKVKVTINENSVYLIKIPILPENLTLADLKKKMPKKGPFQYFVKTILEDGDTGFEEYDDDTAILPLFEDKIIVECNTI